MTRTKDKKLLAPSDEMIAEKKTGLFLTENSVFQFSLSDNDTLKSKKAADWTAHITIS